MPQTIPPLPPFQATVQAQQVAELLRTVDVGNYIEQQAIADKLGVSLAELDRHRYWLETGMKMLAREGQHFQSKGRKVYHLSDDGIRQRTDSKLTGVGRTVRRESKRLADVNATNLNPEQRLKHLVTYSRVAVYEALAKRRAQNQIENKVKAAQQKLPVDATLALLLGQEKNGDKGTD